MVAPARPLGLTYRTLAAVLRPALLALGRRDWSGREYLPREGVGCVVVSNHISHLDPLTLSHFLYANRRAPRMLAKSEIMKTPVVGGVLRRCGQITVVRGTAEAPEALEQACEAVGRGECVVVYPEGSLTRDPDLWPMRAKTGAARVALTSGCDIVPIAQWGAHRVLPPYAGLPRLIPRATFVVRAGPPVDLDDLRGKPLTPQIAAAATERVMASIVELLEELRGEVAPAQRFSPEAHGLPPTGNPRKRRSQA